MRLIKSHASGRKLIACRGQEEVSFSPHAALHNWLSAVCGGVAFAGTLARWLPLEWVTKLSIMAASWSTPCCHLLFLHVLLLPWCWPYLLAHLSSSFLSILCVLTLCPRFLPLPPPSSFHTICTFPPPTPPTPCLCSLPQAPTRWLEAQANKPHSICLSLSKADPSWRKKMCWGGRRRFMIQVVNLWYFLQFLCSFILIT